MDMVKKRRCLSLPEVRRLTVQLCGAIKYMHARNVIHRDLKMGNLFLDHEMNLKIGDFGLAAVLASKSEIESLVDYGKQRRTTLCGTPNYIAPEILEKGKGGHDHKVDIWAIGVIVYVFEEFVFRTRANTPTSFAMIAGQPPFQSSSQGEIYRRARSVEYTWPEPAKYSNDIPEEAKDLVARLLKVDAEERPDPDQVIGHPFFAMHGGNAIPAVMEEHFRTQTPRFLDIRARPHGDVMLKATERLALRSLAKHCGVGHLQGDKAPQTTVGEDTDLSLYKECAAEEKAGLSPIVPVPKDMVYTSKFQSSDWPSLPISDVGQSVPKAEDVATYDAVPSRSLPRNEVEISLPDRPRRGPVQSHAATLRAAQAGSKPRIPRAQPRFLNIEEEAPRSKNAAYNSVRERRRLLNEMPVRSTTLASIAGNQQAATVNRRPRAARSKKVVVLDDIETPDSAEAAQMLRPTTKDEIIDAVCTDSDVKRSELAARSRARIASNIQSEMVKPANNKVDVKADSDPVRPRDISDSPPPGNALIGPNEVAEELPRTKPDEVLSQLQELHRELEASLSNIAKSRHRSSPDELDIKNDDIKRRPVVVKWVDYTNKFGIGYILANGTVGCVFKGDGSTPPTCVVVADAETHLKKRKTPKYPEKHQMVPKRCSPIEFIENCGDDGLKRVLVQPSHYQVKVSPEGLPDRLAIGTDTHDFEKRKKLCLWDKFAKYMTQTLGKSEETNLSTESDSTVSKPSRRSVAGPFVKFYQRLGNVGIWGFADGSFQFNFPDHTKLVVSDSGRWLDFYHLPLAAARALRAGQVLDPGVLAERSVLCCPTAAMLGSGRDEEFRSLVRENELKAKVAFVRDVVGIWIQGGGLGCMGRRKGMKWDGMMEKGGKLVWVSVGARGGDVRYESPGGVKG